MPPSENASPSDAYRRVEKRGVPVGELRKVQLTGGSTYIISLPKDWVRDVGISAQDQVAIIPQTDMSLVVIPSEDLKKKEAEEAEIEVTSSDPNVVIRTFIAHYLNGFDIIRLKFRPNSSPDVRAQVKSAIRKQLIGVEIIEESADEIATQCLPGYVDLPLKKALSRMSVITSSMQFDAVNAFLKDDTAMAREIVDRDDEVDRFYHFIIRQLALALSNRMMIQEIGLQHARDCLGYRMIVKSIERIADHAGRVAETTLMLTKKPLPPEASDIIQKLGTMSNQVYEDAMKSLFTMNGKLANETIAKSGQVVDYEEKGTEHIYGLRLDTKSVVALRLAMESLRRIGEYSTDICEIVINMMVKRSLP
jgi:phosphate uptake regulator